MTTTESLKVVTAPLSCVCDDRIHGKLKFSFRSTESDSCRLVLMAENNSTIKGYSGELISEKQNITFWSSLDRFTEHTPKNSTSIIVYHDNGKRELLWSIESRQTESFGRQLDHLMNTLSPQKSVFFYNEYSEYPTLKSWKSGLDPFKNSSGWETICGDVDVRFFLMKQNLSSYFNKSELVYGGDRFKTQALEKSANQKLIMIIVVVAIGAASKFLVLAYCLWSRKLQRYDLPLTVMTDDKSSNKETRLEDYGVNEEDLKHITLFEYKQLEVATNVFSETNQLGRGGFGPVYKGKLDDGREIAVKRLLSPSGQGLLEFKNEVVLISKLQHRNLVTLLGCCVKGEEKLLVYEYMPNKSLDAHLFDSSLRKQLDWKKRFEIINGICRGVVYLHRDSRLKIIHRDLKASNILLDEELNPKISDFGIARKMETKQDQATTMRVVGTYGYMSPEYAMEGRFSEKSDVFSLGILLLEIVSGKASHIKFESLSLLPYAWKLWKEDDILSLVDETIYDPSFEGEMLKCIQLGLLCVQERPEDRPTISALVSMLEVNDVTNLPRPTTQHVFTQITTFSIDNTPSDQITSDF